MLITMTAHADLWTHEQLNGGAGKVARGVRVDVPRPAAWMQVRLERMHLQFCYSGLLLLSHRTCLHVL